MASKSQVTLTFTGNEKDLERSFGRVEKMSQNFGSGMAKVGTVAVAATAAVAAGAVAAGAALFELGSNFDAAHDTIVAGTGASGAALEDLKQSFDNVLTSVPTTFGDASTAIADINTALGLTGKPLEDLSKQFINLSRVSGEDLAPSIQSVTRLFGDWGVEADQQSVTMDKLWAVSQATGIGINELSDQMVKAGAPLRQLGFSMEESAAIFGKWNKEGVNTEVIFSGVRTAISKMAKAGEDIPTAFAAAQDAIMNAGSASEATSIAIEVFGAKAGPDMAAAILEGRFAIEDLVAVMDDAEGSIQRTADDTESFGEKWQLFKNQLAVAFKPAAIAIFEGLGDVMERLGPILTNTIIPAITDTINAVKSMADEFLYSFNSGFTEDEGTGIENFALKLRDFKNFVVDDFVPAVIEAIDWFKATWEEIGPDVMRHVDRVKEVIGSGMAFIIQVIESTIELVTWIWNNWGEEITAVVTWAFDLIAGIVDGALTVLKGTFDFWTAVLEGDWDAAWAAVKDIFDGYMVIIKAIGDAAWEAIKAAANAAWDALVDYVTGKLEDLKSNVTSILDAVKLTMTNKWNAIWDKVQEVWQRILDFISDTANGAKDAVTGSFDAIVDFFANIGSRLASALSDVPGAVTKPFRDAYNGATEWLNKIPSVGSVTRSFGGFSIPQFHGGGEYRSASPGGEGLALLKDREQVFTPEQVRALGEGYNTARNSSMGGGGGEMVLRIDSGGSALDRAILEILRRAVSEQGGNVQMVVGV